MANVIRIHEHGTPSVMRLEAEDIRAPAHGEVCLRQEAIGVNYVDTMVRDGRFGLPLPVVLGFEGAGVVTSIGTGVTGYSIGDRVGYFFSAGGYASERVIDANALIALPQDITTEQAATFLAKGLTAWMGLRALHELRRGEVVLVQGASGGVGSILSRWARVIGATVIGVASSVDKLPKVQAGADHALCSGDPLFNDKVRAVAPDGVDTVYDMVGQANFAQTIQIVRDGGKIVTIGAASGKPQFDAAALAVRDVEVKGGGTPQYVNAETVATASAELFKAIRENLFGDLAVSRYPLADAAQAHHDQERRLLTGLPILVP